MTTENERTCTACGQEMPAEEKSCPNCGTYIGITEPEPADEASAEAQAPIEQPPSETDEAPSEAREPVKQSDEDLSEAEAQAEIEDQEADDLPQPVEAPSLDDRPVTAITCPHCDQTHPPEAIFCPFTGRRMLELTTCPQCKKRVQPEWVICAYCGRSLRAGGVEITASQLVKPLSLVLLGLLLGLIVMVSWLLSAGRSSQVAGWIAANAPSPIAALFTAPTASPPSSTKKTPTGTSIATLFTAPTTSFSLSTKKTATATSIAPVLPPTKDPYFFDDFEGDIGSQPFDQTRWDISWDSGEFEVVQENGRLRMSGSGVSAGGVYHILPRQYQNVRLDEIGAFEAKLMLASDHIGGHARSEMTIISESEGESIWEALCIISADETRQPQLHCEVHSEPDYTYQHTIYYSAASYDEWYTVRVEVDPGTDELFLFLDADLIGSFTIPEDKEWQPSGMRLSLSLEAGRSTGAFATSYIDDVFISGKREAVPPTPTP